MYGGQWQGLLQLQAWVSANEGLHEGLYDKRVSVIPNNDEILKLVKKKNELIRLHLVDTMAWSCKRPWQCTVEKSTFRNICLVGKQVFF